MLMTTLDFKIFPKRNLVVCNRLWELISGVKFLGIDRLCGNLRVERPETPSSSGNIWKHGRPKAARPKDVCLSSAPVPSNLSGLAYKPLKVAGQFE